MKKLIYMFVYIFLFVVSASSGAAAETIIIAGDPCTVPLAQKLGEAFTKKTGVDVKIAVRFDS